MSVLGVTAQQTRLSIGLLPAMSVNASFWRRCTDAGQRAHSGPADLFGRVLEESQFGVQRPNPDAIDVRLGDVLNFQLIPLNPD